jgi:hypothetical protein
VEADDPVCLRCIGDEELRRQLRDEAGRSVCASCGKRRQAVPLSAIAERVDPIFRQYYHPGGDVPHFDVGFDNPSYEQDGEDPQSIIAEIAGVEPDISDAIVDHLSDGESRDVTRGSDAYYDATSRYVARELHATELHMAWEEFCARVKHKRRFFDAEGQNILSTILGDRESIGRENNPLSACVVKLQAGERCFRARRAETDGAARLIMSDPRRLLSPPPPHLTPAGRMNSAGIPVFYGGFSEDVCIAEVRPYVGGLVVVGEFRTTRPLRLLNLMMLEENRFVGSIFRSDFYERVTKRQFLRNFHDLISRPIQPHEEMLEYLTTQAVAEYISNVLGLDGIIYESAQTGRLDENTDHEDRPVDRSKQNLALFNHAALVQGSQQPRKRKKNPLFEWSETNDSAAERRRPSLRFVIRSASVIRVTGIHVLHQRAVLPSRLGRGEIDY